MQKNSYSSTTEFIQDGSGLLPLAKRWNTLIKVKLITPSVITKGTVIYSDSKNKKTEIAELINLH